MTMKTCSVILLSAVAVVACLGCGSSGPGAKGPISPGPYTVVDAEDNLSNLALRAYGDMELWFGLLNANPHLGQRPGFDLVPGETLQIPAKEKLNMSLPKSVFPESLPADYIIMPGDSLHFIAQNVYGNRDEWMRIYEANRHKLSEKVKLDTRQLIAGEVLHLPAMEEEDKEGTGDRERGTE